MVLLLLDLPPLQPSAPPRVAKHKTAKSNPLRWRLQGNVPKANRTASVSPELFHVLSWVTEALAAVVEMVKVLEAGELPATCACAGLREQVGGLFGVP